MTEEVSDCCKSEMIPPDWDAAEKAGSLWRAYVVYICKVCKLPCCPISKESKNKNDE